MASRTLVLPLCAAIAVALGAGAAGARADSAPLYSLGINDVGQLGTPLGAGTNGANPSPVSVDPGGTVTQISAERDDSLVLLSTGQVKGFGTNQFGQLGTTTNNRSANPNPTPTDVPIPGRTRQIATSGVVSLAVTEDGRLFSFGSNINGALGRATNSGNGSPNPVPTQVSLPGATGTPVQAAAGDFHSLVLTSAGEVFGFGNASAGALGSLLTGPQPTPVKIAIPGAIGQVVQVAAGSLTSFALTSSGQVFAWGDNLHGELGIATNAGTSTANPTPAVVGLPGATGPAVAIAAGGFHTLVLTRTGQVFSFGRNAVGELGRATNLGTENANPTPAVVALAEPAIAIAAGSRVDPDGEHSLVLTASGRVFGFGSSAFGQLGNAAAVVNTAPVEIALPDGRRAGAISAGLAHTLIVPDDLAASTAGVTAGEVGVPYHGTVSASGGLDPVRWTSSGLPAGLALDTATGAISGTPTTAGATAITFTVVDAHGVTRSAATTLTVNAPPVIAGPMPAPVAPISIVGGAQPGPSAPSANAAPKELNVATSLTWNRLKNGRTQLATLNLTGIANGDRVRVACTGKGCPKALKKTMTAKKVKRRALSLTSVVRDKVLKGGLVLTITVERAGFVGSVTTYTMVTRHNPRKAVRCLDPGAKKPRACG